MRLLLRVDDLDAIEYGGARIAASVSLRPEQSLSLPQRWTALGQEEPVRGWPVASRWWLIALGRLASVVAPDPRNAGARHDLSEQADAAHVECEGTGLTAGDHEPDLPDA